MLLEGFALGVLVVLIVVATYNWTRKEERGDFPPGPFAWPLIGHLHLFSHPKLRDLSLTYGPILGLRLGCHRAIVVSTPALAKQLLFTHDKVFSDRMAPQFTSLLLFRSHIHGVTFSSPSSEWQKRRKLCVLSVSTAKRLRELQPMRQRVIHSLLLSIDRQSSAGTTAVHLGKFVGQMSAQLTMCLLNSKETLHTAGEDLKELITDQELLMVPTMGDLMPFLSWLDFFTKRHMLRVHARLDKVYSEVLMERKESRAVHDDDLLETLLSQQEPLSTDEIKAILGDMLGAGIHTTALSLEWAMAELMANPHCLRRLQSEIDTQLGEKKLVDDADLPKLSYLKCVVKETSRLHPLVPLLVPRLSIEECKVQGYTIPAKTLAYVNVWAIGRDEQVWPNANAFMPERFEGSDIDLKGQHFELLPFGSGRRSCLGLPLAVPVVETTLANLVRCFDWQLPEGETLNMDENCSFTLNRASPLIAIPKRRVSFSDLTGHFVSI